MAGAVVVVGSLNMDFVVTVEHLPAPGETVLGRDFRNPAGRSILRAGQGRNGSASAIG